MNEQDILSTDLGRLLASVEWTFRTHIAPNVTGSLPQSYARTVGVLLSQALAQLRHQGSAARADLFDLSGLLIDLEVTAPKVEAERDEDVERSLARLDATLSAAIPNLDPGRMALVDAFLARRIDRRRRWMPDNAPTNAF